MVVRTSLWPKQLLHSTNVVSVFQQMRREAMTKGMTTSVLIDLGQSNSVLHGSLKVVGVNMMASLRHLIVDRVSVSMKETHIASPTRAPRSDIFCRERKEVELCQSQPLDRLDVGSAPFSNGPSDSQTLSRATSSPGLSRPCLRGRLFHSVRKSMSLTRNLIASIRRSPDP